MAEDAVRNKIFEYKAVSNSRSRSLLPLSAVVGALTCSECIGCLFWRAGQRRFRLARPAISVFSRGYCKGLLAWGWLF